MITERRRDGRRVEVGILRAPLQRRSARLPRAGPTASPPPSSIRSPRCSSTRATGGGWRRESYDVRSTPLAARRGAPPDLAREPRARALAAGSGASVEEGWRFPPLLKYGVRADDHTFHPVLGARTRRRCVDEPNPRACRCCAALGLLGADRAAPEPRTIASCSRSTRGPRPSRIPNRTSITEARAELGRALFFDPRLSGSNFIACASCHNPGFSWSDPLPKAIGHGMNELGRRTPSILNLAWGEPLLLGRPRREPRGAGDGPDHGARRDEPERRGAGRRARRDSRLRAAVRGRLSRGGRSRPTRSRRRSRRSSAAWSRARRRSTAGWRATSAPSPTTAKRGFRAVRGQGAAAPPATAAGASRTTASTTSAWSATTAAAARWWPTSRCSSTRSGRPALRNTARRAPYGHNGSEKTLADVIELYDMGGRVKRPSLSPEIQPLHLTARREVGPARVPRHAHERRRAGRGAGAAAMKASDRARRLDRCCGAARRAAGSRRERRAATRRGSEGQAVLGRDAHGAARRGDPLRERRHGHPQRVLEVARPLRST